MKIPPTKWSLQVLITGPDLHDKGGVANYLLELLNHISSDQVCYTYIPVGRRSGRSPVWRRPIEYVESIFRFSFALKKTKPAVVHLNPSLSWRSLPLNLILLTLTKLVGKQPVLIFFRGWYKEVADAITRDNLIGNLVKRVLKQADYYLVLSRKFLLILLKAGFPSEHIMVSTVMVDVASYQLPERKSPTPEKTLHVLFLSSLLRDKGVFELADSIEWWQKNYPDTKAIFTIAGNGSEYHQLQTRLNPQIEAGMVYMPGDVRGEAKMQCYYEADVFVFPSYHEGFPNVVVEALAAGLPLIYTPVGALDEILGPENGTRVELTDLSGESLGRAMYDLYRDLPRRQAISLANRKLAQERYDVGIVCAQMVDIYQRISEMEPPTFYDADFVKLDNN